MVTTTSERAATRRAPTRGLKAVGALTTTLLSMMAACGPDPMWLGAAADVIWWTDHETGDLSDWDTGDVLQGKHWTENGELTVTAVPNARSGRYVMRSTITTAAGGMTMSGACAQKQGQPPRDAYYSAWFYVPDPAPRPESWWLAFKFRSRTVAADEGTQVDVWDVDFSPRKDGKLGLSLYSHLSTGSTPADAGPIVPTNQWFQLEAFLRVAQDQTGLLEVWMNDQPLPAFSGQTMPSTWVEWSVGSISQSLSPATATLLIDDAAISRRRLGSAEAPLQRSPQ